MFRRAFLVAALVACVLLPAEGASPPLRRFPFWACSDGKGTVSLFWLPVGGEWPAGGYRLERVSRGKAAVLGGPFRPGRDARAMMEVDPADADAIRSLADGIERGMLSDDEKNRSVSVLGRAAAADGALGRALGVRYTDVPRGRGRIAYRLTPLGADGAPGPAMESLEVDPGKATPAPGRPEGLRAEQRDDGVALFWTDPPAGAVAPVVGYRVDRGDGGRRTAALTPKTLLLDRHLSRGAPEFVDGAPPAKKVTYLVRSVDLFGRLSAPVRTGITVRSPARARVAPGAGTTASKVAVPAAPAPAAARIASAPEPAGRPTLRPIDDGGASATARDGDASSRAAIDRPASPSPTAAAARKAPAPTRLASAAPADAPPEIPGAESSTRAPAPPTGGKLSRKAREEGVPSRFARTALPAREPEAVPGPDPVLGPSRASAPESPPAAAPAPAPGLSPTAPRPPEAPAAVARAAGRLETAAQRDGSPPPPVIMSIAGLGDRVLVRFRPGDPEGLSHTFVFVRSESPTGEGVTVGRPVPGDTREWEDTTVSAGQYFWYRVVALDSAGQRSEPSKPKWVSTGSR